jgi:hypothetical protein
MLKSRKRQGLCTSINKKARKGVCTDNKKKNKVGFMDQYGKGDTAMFIYQCLTEGQENVKMENRVGFMGGEERFLHQRYKKANKIYASMFKRKAKYKLKKDKAWWFW